MKLAICPACRVVHEMVSPTILNGLDHQGVYQRTHCRMCEVPSGYFLPLKETPALDAGEIGYPAAVVPVFDGAYSDWFLADADKVEAVARGGLRMRLARQLADDMRIPWKVVDAWIGARRTATRAKPYLMALEAPQAETLLGIARLIGQAEVVVERSGDPPGFQGAPWMGKWLQTHHQTLGTRPDQFISTAADRKVLSDLFARYESDARS